MVSSGSLYRDADPTFSSSTHRYLASDFQRLTNRIPSSPPFTPDFAHDPGAEYSSNGRTVGIADKRASDARPASITVRERQASRQSSAIRKEGRSSVKEDQAGKLQHLPP